MSKELVNKEWCLTDKNKNDSSLHTIATQFIPFVSAFVGSAPFSSKTSTTADLPDLIAARSGEVDSRDQIEGLQVIT